MKLILSCNLPSSPNAISAAESSFPSFEGSNKLLAVSKLLDPVYCPKFIALSLASLTVSSEFFRARSLSRPAFSIMPSRVIPIKFLAS